MFEEKSMTHKIIFFYCPPALTFLFHPTTSFLILFSLDHSDVLVHKMLMVKINEELPLAQLPTNREVCMATLHPIYLTLTSRLRAA